MQDSVLGMAKLPLSSCSAVFITFETLATYQSCQPDSSPIAPSSKVAQVLYSYLVPTSVT